MSRIAQIALVTGIALSVLGVCTVIPAITHPIAIIPAIVLIESGLAISYASFNIYRLAQNFKTITENPFQYTTMMGLGPKFHDDKLRERLLSGIVAFGWAVDMISGGCAPEIGSRRRIHSVRCVDNLFDIRNDLFFFGGVRRIFSMLLFFEFF